MAGIRNDTGAEREIAADLLTDPAGGRVADRFADGLAVGLADRVADGLVVGGI